MLGYFIQPGGKWSGDYIVVDYEKLNKNPDLSPTDCKIDRMSEIFLADPTVGWKFPLADYRAKKEEEVAIEAPARQ